MNAPASTPQPILLRLHRRPRRLRGLKYIDEKLYLYIPQTRSRWVSAVEDAAESNAQAHATATVFGERMPLRVVVRSAACVPPWLRGETCRSCTPLKRVRTPGGSIDHPRKRATRKPPTRLLKRWKLCGVRNKSSRWIFRRPPASNFEFEYALARGIDSDGRRGRKGNRKN